MNVGNNFFNVYIRNAGNTKLCIKRCSTSKNVFVQVINTYLWMVSLWWQHLPLKPKGFLVLMHQCHYRRGQLASGLVNNRASVAYTLTKECLSWKADGLLLTVRVMYWMLLQANDILLMATKVSTLSCVVMKTCCHMSMWGGWFTQNCYLFVNIAACE